MRPALIALVECVCLMATASAQPVSTLADLPLRLNVGDTVIVDAASEPAIRGTLVRLTPDAITLRLRDRSERSIGGTDVRHVLRRGDSLKNGFVIGAAIGIAGGCLAGAGQTQHWRWKDCPAGMLFFGPLYIGLSVGIDAVHVGTTTVFQAADGERPLAAAGHRVVRVGVTW